jgi:intracellular multiplication protein IcmJ
MPSKSEVADAMQRDGFSCRCCGFTSRKYQRVVPYSADTSAKGMNSFITVCTSCERCLALEQTGLIGGGTLIWLPELSQAELNHVVRALYVARSSNDKTLAAAATRTLDVLMARKSEAKKRLGTDDPLVLATALQEIVDETSYAARVERLEGIRLLASDRYLVRQRTGDIDMFPAMLAYWVSAEGPFGEIPVKDWATRFAQLEELN